MFFSFHSPWTRFGIRSVVHMTWDKKHRLRIYLNQEWKAVCLPASGSSFYLYPLCRSVVMVSDAGPDASNFKEANQVLSSLLDFKPSQWGLPPIKEMAIWRIYEWRKHSPFLPQLWLWGSSLFRFISRIHPIGFIWFKICMNRINCKLLSHPDSKFKPDVQQMAVRPRVHSFLWHTRPAPCQSQQKWSTR